MVPVERVFERLAELDQTLAEAFTFLEAIRVQIAELRTELRNGVWPLDILRQRRWVETRLRAHAVLVDTLTARLRGEIYLLAREQGATLRQIGQAVGISRQMVARLIRRAHG